MSEFYNFEEIIGHRFWGDQWEVEILWQNGEKSWNDLKIMIDDDPESLAEYAWNVPGLRYHPKWKFCFSTNYFQSRAEDANGRSWTREERMMYLHTCIESNFDKEKISVCIPTKSLEQCSARLRKIVIQEIECRVRGGKAKHTRDAEEDILFHTLLYKYIDVEKENFIRLIARSVKLHHSKRGDSKKKQIENAISVADSFGLQMIRGIRTTLEEYLDKGGRSPMISKKNMVLQNHAEPESDTGSLVDEGIPARKEAKSGYVTPSPTNLPSPILELNTSNNMDRDVRISSDNLFLSERDSDLDDDNDSDSSSLADVLPAKRKRKPFHSIYPYVDEKMDFFLNSTWYDSGDDTSRDGGMDVADESYKNEPVRIISHGWIDEKKQHPWAKVLYGNGDEYRAPIHLLYTKSLKLSKMIKAYANKLVPEDIEFQDKVRGLGSFWKSPHTNTKKKSKNNNTLKAPTSRIRSQSKPSRPQSSSNRTRRVISSSRQIVPKHINRSITITGCDEGGLGDIRVITRSSVKQKNCFLDELLGNRHAVTHMATKDFRSLPLTQAINGCHLDLLSIKFQADPEKANFSFTGGRSNNDQVVISCFARSHDGISIQDELEKLANWAVLPVQKIAARFQLMQSPLIRLKAVDGDSHVQYCVHDSIFEDVEESGHTGCGFIDPEFLEKILGQVDGARTNSIQVRLFIPRKGVYKGMLMKKRMDPNSLVKVLLPESMKKVPPSTRPSSEYGSICICKAGTDPSKKCILLGKLLNREFRRKTLDKQDLKLRLDAKKEGEGMITRLFKHYGVPVEDMKKYHDNIEEFVKAYNKVTVDPSEPDITLEDRRHQVLPTVPIHHAYVRGVADPTGKIPHDMVFIPGLQKDPATLDGVNTIVITRSPALLAEDMRMVKLMTTKPDSMSDEDFEFLNSLKLGVVIFGFSLKGFLPIPECISGGDLDGDRYFCCWDKELLSKIQLRESLTYTPIIAPPDEGKPEGGLEQNANWLRDLQNYITESQEVICDKQELVGHLYNASISAAAKDNVSFLENSDAVAFAKGYIDAINTAKHGTAIRLRKDLWNKFLSREDATKKYHHLLTDE